MRVRVDLTTSYYKNYLLVYSSLGGDLWVVYDACANAQAREDSNARVRAIVAIILPSDRRARGSR